MNASPKFTNALIHETSPYLLQHAHNPVQWIPWSANLFALATAANKPILVSIGYAACHWCHVMEHESFEAELVAAYMNAHFINVKVDREERPDIDHIYMESLQAMTGSGGWPLNIFLLPNGKPFYGGTYFPPVAMQHRASWMDVLKGVHEAYENNNEQLVQQAEQLTNHLVQANISKLTSFSQHEQIATEDEVALIAQGIMQAADKQWGGFGNAPKFPQTFAIQMLLRSYYLHKDQDLLQHALLSLDKMIQGGIYDHLGGGFSRYSTDGHWQAPHFEKMLYDNALLITVLAEAHQITQKETYKLVIQKTIHFLNSALSNGKGVYYASLDADSEGVEGKFYTWRYDEIIALLPPDTVSAFCKYFQITETGNWEGTNILWTQQDFMLGETTAINEAKQLLFKARAQRVPPALDYKIVLSWNNLMVIALCKSYAALSDESLKQQAIEAMQWIEQNMYNANENYYYHTHTKGINKNFAFLDDYATLIQAYIALQEVTGNKNYLFKAKHWTEYVLKHFVDEQNVFFYYTPDYQSDIVLRKKEIYDGAQPSGNAAMSLCLFYLGHQFALSNWNDHAQIMVGSMRKMILQYPSSFSIWAQAFSIMAVGFTELVAIGPTVQLALPQVQKAFMPFNMVLFIKETDPLLALTVGKQCVENQYFICKNGTCLAPVSHLSHYLAKI